MRVSNENGVAKPDDLMAGIGYGKYSARCMLAKVVPPGRSAVVLGTKRSRAMMAARRSSVRSACLRRRQLGHQRARGTDDLLVYRARCCNPIRGEEIVGYVTRGKGVAVHRKTCPTCRT